MFEWKENKFSWELVPTTLLFDVAYSPEDEDGTNEVWECSLTFQAIFRLNVGDFVVIEKEKDFRLMVQEVNYEIVPSGITCKVYLECYELEEGGNAYNFFDRLQKAGYQNNKWEVKKVDEDS